MIHDRTCEWQTKRGRCTCGLHGVKNMDKDIRPRFEQWATAREWHIARYDDGGGAYIENYVESAWLAWLAASEGERARVSACLI